ncbi:uncharacterized protein LOC107787054 isoform X1 [Nicotiana tabacum]|uniref:Uncharacterized protein LOC107787054 isoform X1 n=11 Tax=Nicotiana tabacum TaxID=4097 RepID=A0AC58TLR2_TOBAC
MNIFDLRPYDQLINKVDVNETELFDVIGEIVGFSEVHTHKQGGISRKFMDIELEDDERKKLSATFWGEFVDEIVPHLLISNSQLIIIVMQLIKAHKFQAVIHGSCIEFVFTCIYVQSLHSLAGV